MKNEVTFRYATAADFGAILELASQLAREIECEPPPLTVAKLEAYYVGPNSPMHLLLAIQKSQIVGMIAWTLTHELYSADTRVYISDVSVDRSARGKGIGAALMNEVTLWARARNASKLSWEVWYRNFAAKSFYQRLGASIDDEAISFVMALKDQS